MNNKIIVYVSIAIVVLIGVYFSKPSNIADESSNQNISEQTSLPETKTSEENVTPKNTIETSPEAPVAKTHNISIANFAFSPNTLTINKGDTIIWTNNDSAPHDVRSTDSNVLKSQTMMKEGVFSFTFNDIGTYNYFCSIHPSMKASVTVK